MTKDSTEDLSPFDRQLVGLAKAIMDSEAPDVPQRVWLEDSLFRAMVCIALTRQGKPEHDTLAACERVGRVKAQTYAEHFAEA